MNWPCALAIWLMLCGPPFFAPLIDHVWGRR